MGLELEDTGRQSIASGLALQPAYVISLPVSQCCYFAALN